MTDGKQGGGVPQGKHERRPPEAILNAAGSVWDVDTLLRQGGDGGGGTSAGLDLFLAVGTGPLRQTDHPIEEVGVGGGGGASRELVACGVLMGEGGGPLE